MLPSTASAPQSVQKSINSGASYFLWETSSLLDWLRQPEKQKQRMGKHHLYCCSITLPHQPFWATVLSYSVCSPKKGQKITVYGFAEINLPILMTSLTLSLQISCSSGSCGFPLWRLLFYFRWTCVLLFMEIFFFVIKCWHNMCVYWVIFSSLKQLL